MSYETPQQPSAPVDKTGWSKPLPEIIPPPTFAPVFFSAGIVFTAWGPLTSWILSAVGLGLIILALRVWLGELRADWKKTAQASKTSTSSSSHE
ncbi:hypothetical protein SAMN05444156_2722 [Verrucomicrobium sp. GAS474]|uniref:hypothetical protein n=1 Tax=Verrucomicrobium sp. GAS474 TaxID=1882831 RepID=UPI00087BC34F|nr:hypothetical protein [Verrucomicrobium sp. GAS474]SDU22716.1 hypothetical protein SAMN05444156_2722 [Verrucomicrobium sp. GAS474]